ncbi:MAG: nucleoside deaminase [Balneolaceae bacterium]
MDIKFMERAAELARNGMDRNEGGPFGCVIVKNGEILSEGNNRVTVSHDPTAHAEIVAIRRACEKLGDFQLTGCEIYATCEPCPMCLGAIYWARPEIIYYAGTREDAAGAGFDDSLIYEELDIPPAERKIPMKKLGREKASELFKLWDQKDDKIAY